MNLFDFDARVSATAVAAAGTVIGALAQLRMAWRKEVAERARGVPATKSRGAVRSWQYSCSWLQPWWPVSCCRNT